MQAVKSKSFYSRLEWSCQRRFSVFHWWKSIFVESDAAVLPRGGSSFINKVSAHIRSLFPCVSNRVGLVSFCNWKSMWSWLMSAKAVHAVMRHGMHSVLLTLHILLTPELNRHSCTIGEWRDTCWTHDIIMGSVLYSPCADGGWGIIF